MQNSLYNVITDPILSDYNRIIDSLVRQLNIFKYEQKDLKLKVLKLVEHNKKLASELKEAVQIRINAESVIESLQQQLLETVRSKTALTDLSQSGINKSSYEGKDIPSGFDALKIENHITQIKEHYTKGLKILSDELSEAQNQLACLKDDYNKRGKKLEMSQSRLGNAEEMVRHKEKCNVKLTGELQELKKNILKLETQLSDKSKLFDIRENENATLKKHNVELQDLVTQLTEKVTHLEYQNSFLETEAKRNLLDAQEALLQKKALAHKELLAMSFIEDLKSSISQEVEQNNCIHEHKVKNIQKECEERVLQLLEEVKSLQVQNSEKQSLFERAVREKNAFESKLRSASNVDNPFVSLAMFEEVYRKLSKSERARNESLLQIQSLDNSLRDLQQNHIKETEFFKAESKELKKKMQKLKKELQEALKDRMQLTDQTTKLKKMCSEMEKQLDLLEAQREKEISSLKQSLKKQKETSEYQMKISEDQYKKNMIHLHEMFNAQYLMSTKWKSALQDLTVKSELKIKELFQVVMQLQQEQKSNEGTHEQQKDVL